MDNLIQFFLKNEKLNYFLFVTLIVLGIYSYTNTPKEIFPTMSLDKVQITGGYAGSSIDNLNKMAVIDIEDKISSIEGITEINTVIQPGTFTISADIENKDKYKVLDDVKNEIDKIVSNLPSDMDTPVASINERKIQLLDITISQKNENIDLIKKANEIESVISKINGVGDVIIFGDSEEHILFKLKEKAILAYGLNPNQVIATLNNLSYVFPLGVIEQLDNKNYYLSSYNGKKKVKELNNTLITVSGKKIYLKDILNIEKRYKDESSYSTVNGVKTLTLRVNKSEDADSIKLSEIIKEKVNELNKQDVTINLEIFLDTTKWIKERIDIVMSNIILGVILVIFSLFLLINKRISFVVGLGIPTAFLMGAIGFNYLGHTINLISLLGVLIAIGILVDDAIIVAENIQRHLEEGKDKLTAALEGTKEVAMPVVIASFTTLFAFFPMLNMSGEMGNFIIMIPLAIIVLIVASVIESFLFLPLHAKHILDKKEKERDWSKFINKYKSLLSFLVKWEKTSVITFIIIVPLLTFGILSNTKFQFFPAFDSNNIYVTGKLDVNTELEETKKLLKIVEQKVNDKKLPWSIKNTNGTAGFRVNARNEVEYGSNLLYVVIELNERKPVNFVDHYITPYISFYYEKEAKKRQLSSLQIAKQLQEVLKEVKQTQKQQFNIVELEVKEDTPGIVKADVLYNIKSTSNDKTVQVVNKLKQELSNINGIKNVIDNANNGIEEVKIKLNSYGEKLGFTEVYVSKYISDNFLGNKKGSYYDTQGVFDIVYENNDKDKFNQLKKLQIPLIEQNGYVSLTQVVDFIKIQNFEKMEKENGDSVKVVMANVNANIITATEVLQKMEPIIKEITKNGDVSIQIRGEKEEQERLKNDVQKAFAMAIFLILIALLFMFNSFLTSIIILSVIPLSFLGVLIGHTIMGMNLTMPSIIGALGLAGVVINDGIVMLSFLKNVKTKEEFLIKASNRLRPIFLTSITTFIGLGTLMFFATGQAIIMQPLAISLGFGLLWGTVLNLLFVPVLFAITKRI